MYLRLEQNILIPKGKILGIFDLDNSSWEKNTKNFLSQAEKEGRVFTCSLDFPRSFLLVGEDFGNVTIYLTSKSTTALANRAYEKIYLQEY